MFKSWCKNCVCETCSEHTKMVDRCNKKCARDCAKSQLPKTQGSCAK